MTRLNKSFSNCAGHPDAALMKIYPSFSQIWNQFQFQPDYKSWLHTQHNTRLMDETREQETSVEERPWALRPGDKNLSCDTSRKNSATLPMVQRRCGGGHRDLGPDPQQQQRLPRRGKLRLSTPQTLFCQQSAHAFTPQLSLATF